jgi:hypothetical protein
MVMTFLMSFLSHQPVVNERSFYSSFSFQIFPYIYPSKTIYMNMSFVKKLLAAVIISSTLVSFSTKADHTNFSGSWTLNEGKSDFGERGARFATKALKVEQKDDAITISRTTPSFQGGDDVTTTEILGFDGKEVQGTGFGGSVRKSTLKWAADGQSLSISSTTTGERNGQSFTFSSTETWTLGDGGKSLTVTAVRSSQQGEVTTKAAYDKQ